MSVSGEMQAKVFQDIIDERCIDTVIDKPRNNCSDSNKNNQHTSVRASKIKALVTNNAAVMKKTWRILTRDNPGFYAYGCICHCYNLLNKDVYKLEPFKSVMQRCRKITTWFSRHGQDLSIFRRVCIEKFNKEKSLIRAGATRFGSETTSIESCVKASNELKVTVVDPLWDDRKESKKMKLKGRDIRDLIMDTELWDEAIAITIFLHPLNDIISQLQSDKLPFGMVYHSFIQLHHHFLNFPENVVINDTLKEEIASKLLKRLDFLITPAHVAA